MKLLSHLMAITASAGGLLVAVTAQMRTGRGSNGEAALSVAAVLALPQLHSTVTLLAD